MTRASHLSVGEPAPWFFAAASKNQLDTVAFDELAGRYIVLFFFGDAAPPEVAEAIGAFRRREDLFDGTRAVLLGISNTPKVFEQDDAGQRPRGQIFLWDSNGMAAKHYLMAEAPTDIRPIAFIMDPALQIVAIVPLTKSAEFICQITSLVAERLATPPKVQNAPVLVVPQVFDRSFCDQIIDLYEAAGGREIGAVEYQGKMVERFDPNFRKRLDWYISDKRTIARARELIERRLLPIVYRSFQFRATRIERYLVGCYDAVTGGYFRPHRDNTAPPGAHRRFAVSISLNEDYEGGGLCFPEFGGQPYRAAPGHAIVFSCSLLHEVLPVTRGRRYTFLSFIYDEPSQKLLDAFRQRVAASQEPIEAPSIANADSANVASDARARA